MTDLVSNNGQNYIIKPVGTDNIEGIQSLCNKCDDYFIMDQGTAAVGDEAKNILKELPPKKDSGDKYVYGVYDGNALIGLIDIVRDYPEPGEWFLGLLLIDPSYRGLGIGTYVHKFLTSHIASCGGTKIRLAIFDDNKNAYKFWAKVGYTKVKEVKQKRVNKPNKVLHVMDYFFNQ